MTFIVATGGTISTDGDYKVHTFTSSGTFEVTSGSGFVWYLVVGGGGGGGFAGGGAGGYRTNDAYDYAVSVGEYDVVVGSGGPGGANLGLKGSSGSASEFDTISAAGGGGGGAFSDTNHTGIAGGSGGGGGSESTAPYTGHAAGAGDTPNTTPDQGNDGGAGSTGASGAGGGGGAGADGAAASESGGGTGGNGGDGLESSIDGSSVTRAGGGGGGGGTIVGQGGEGGGGRGARLLPTPASATAAAANTGSGGGGGYTTAGFGKSGGSGIVIIRYRYQETLPPGEQIDQFLYRDLRFPFTTSGRAVQRLMKIELERNRRQRTIQFPAKLTAFRLLPWDGVYLDHERYGFDGEQHRVIGWALAADGGVDLSLQADDASVYAWNRLTDERQITASQEVTVPDGSVPPPTVLVETVQTPSPFAMRIVWFAVIGATAYDVEYQNVDDYPTWLVHGRIADNFATVAYAGTPRNFRVRSVGSSGQTSAYDENLAPVLPTSLAWSNPSLTWHNGAGATDVQVFRNTVDDFASATYVTLVDGPTESYHPPGDDYYWLRSVSETGNISEESASILVSGLP